MYFLHRRSKCHDKNNHLIYHHPCLFADQNTSTAFLSTYEFKSILNWAQKHVENKALLWQERLWNKCKVASPAVRLLLLIEETPNRRGGAQGKSQLKVSCLMKDIPAKCFAFSTPCRFYRKLRKFRRIIILRTAILQ